VLGETYRLGSFEVRAGDWLLMRNPSPYNRFSNVAPGLFTHVGVVAVETGPDGVRRFVIVDLPERGSRIPATTIDTYLTRTLHFVFLRHEDPAAGARMGQAVVDLIGNEVQFDLTFRTNRVQALQGKPLKGATIHTYCAGLLLLCAQAAGVPRAEVFPVAEAPAPGNTLKNLATLGLSIGDDFISPTGALFSSRLKLVGQREPMYSPGREVQEAIYDHFAAGMIQRTLRPSPDAYQSLRQKLAGLSKTNPWLARAMARANQVHEKTDLESAAKAAGVIETLDEIAEAQVGEFAAAYAALTAEDAPRPRLSVRREELQQQTLYRQRHAELFQALTGGRLSLRQLRMALVQYYAQQGQRQLDQRFFP
jgi:hypothetical protein